jgi:beta-lactamase superfamily II metal-dependent hydrolase
VTAEAVPKGGRTSAIIDPLRCLDEDPKLTVLWGSLAQRPEGWSNDEFENENNHSVTVRIDFGRASFLVTGDLELEGITSLLAKHAGSTALDVDVWQASHHGSYNGTTKPLTDTLTPVIALLGTGREERHVFPMSAWAFGHPRKVVVDLLETAVTQSRPTVTVRVATGTKTFQNQIVDRAIYATGWDGSVVVTADQSGAYDVETEW